MRPGRRSRGPWCACSGPYATKVEVIRKADGQAFDMPSIHADGLYELFFPNEKPFAYSLRLTWFDKTTSVLEDPYRFPLQMTDLDMYLLGEGTNYRAYHKMGAHPMTIDGVAGVHFAVWAPNAIRVSVVGWFNNWDGRIHPMQQRGSSGLWELFMPHLKAGDLYKFEIKGHNAFLAQKSDPFAFASELRPRSASMVWNNEAYAWKDAEWIENAQADALARSADQRLRGASELVAAQSRREQPHADLPGAGGDAAALREEDGLHAHRDAADQRASVRRLLGLPDHRLLFADLPLRHAGRLQVSSWTAATRRASA